MEFIERLLIETKVFVLSLEGGSWFCITERSGKTAKEMILSQSSAHWLANAVEECTLLEGSKNFYKPYRDGTKALFVHLHSNDFGWYFEVTEYGSSGCSGPPAISEGTEGGVGNTSPGK